MKGYTTTGVILHTACVFYMEGEKELKVNGEDRQYSDITLSDMLGAEGYSQGCVAAEVDGMIVPRGMYDSFVLSGGETVEIIRLVAGG